MIGIIFQFINEVIEVRVDGTNCFFRTGQFGGAFVPIDSLRLEKKGVFKEHPDLKDKENWREEAIKRFKEYVHKLNNEEQRVSYIITELSKCGYKPLYKQKSGFRPEQIK